MARKMRWAVRVARRGNMTDLFKVLAKYLQGRQPFAKFALRLVGKVETDIMWGCEIYSNSEV
jgi:hypothetical protein